jgi:hypothetical protein
MLVLVRGWEWKKVGWENVRRVGTVVCRNVTADDVDRGAPRDTEF